MSKKESLKIERLRTIARSRSGQVLVEWLEEIVRTYADVRNVKSNLTFEARRDAVNIIENDIIGTLKALAKEQRFVETGGDLE